MANIKNNSVRSKEKQLNKKEQKWMKAINLLRNKAPKLINKTSRKINEIIKIKIQGAENHDIEGALQIQSKTYIKRHSDSLVNLEQSNLKNRKDIL